MVGLVGGSSQYLCEFGCVCELVDNDSAPGAVRPRGGNRSDIVLGLRYCVGAAMWICPCLCGYRSPYLWDGSHTDRGEDNTADARSLLDPRPGIQRAESVSA